MPKYYDVPTTLFTCSSCQWSGVGAALVTGEVFSDVVEYNCPRCGSRLTFAQFPDREETKSAANAGNQEAARELARFDERHRWWDRVLETRRSDIVARPELANGDVRCVLSLEQPEGRDTWLVLSANGLELHREGAVFEDTEPAHRLLAAVHERFGDRLVSFDYDPAFLYLAGDRLGVAAELDGLVGDLHTEH